MEILGPRTKGHSKVPWPVELNKVETSIPSWIHQLLRHNSPPSITEQHQLNSMRSTLPRSLLDNNYEQENIAKQIKDLQSRLQYLKVEHCRMQKQSFICEVIMSPFRRLPNDIVYKIIATASTDRYVGEMAGSRCHVPSTLAQVSRHLRDTVFGVSRLWNNMKICFQLPKPDPVTFLHDYRPIMDQIKHFSYLSSSLPITLELTECNIETHLGSRIGGQYYGLYPILEWIIHEWTSRDRLSRLTIASPRIVTLLREFKDQLSTAPVPPLPSLASCSFQMSQMPAQDSTDVGDDLVVITDKLQNLRKLWVGHEVMQVEGIFDGSTLAVATRSSWSKLTEIHISSPLRRDEWHGILQACPQLRFGGFTLDEFDEGGLITTNFNFVTLTHQNLDDLRLNLQEETQHAYVFLGFKFPRLTTLHLRFHNAELANLGKLPTVANRVSGIFPSLQRLILGNMPRSNITHSR
ncbi:hypothetical protein BJ165DRAFT_319506 [Panaeolus papilionaceus]|nr:hypothetical protein BJ165DRAFT_319506 [Panaeolus papilionaceus]